MHYAIEDRLKKVRDVDIGDMVEVVAAYETEFDEGKKVPGPYMDEGEVPHFCGYLKGVTSETITLSNMHPLVKMPEEATSLGIDELLTEIPYDKVWHVHKMTEDLDD